MDRTCEQCEADFVARSPRARFCGPTCRSRAHRGVPPLVLARIVVPLTSVAGTVSVVEATRAEVEALDLASSSAAAQALVLAARLDADADSGTGKAALSRQLEVLLASLRAQAAARDLHAGDDPLTRIRAMREARLRFAAAAE